MAFKILNNTVLHNDSSVIVDELRLGDLNDQPTISDAVLIHDGAGNVTLQNVFFDATTIDVTSLTTDSIAEGATNLYYTDARVDTVVDPQFAAALADRNLIRSEFVAADLAVLADAQSYADSVVSAGTGSLTTDDIPEASNLYFTDNRVQSFLVSNNYATQTYVDQAESNAVITSNAYTNTRETAITSAYRSYTDQAESDAIITASVDATTKANQAEIDANAYTNTRETAITSAYRSYTDQAESNAISSAASDATTKANQAESNAISAAASDATTKANQAESNAISAAASDATTKAAAAQAASESYTDAQVTKTVIDGLNIEAASVQSNSVALGTDTTGNYVATISGTTNEVEVTGSGTETASVTVGLPANVTVSNNLTVEGDLTVNGTTTTVLSSNTRINENLLYLNEGGESTITNAVGNGTQVTYTADNDYSVGYTVDITGVTPSSFNGIDVAVIASDSTSFTIASTNTDTYVSGGEAYGHAHVNVDLGWAGAYDDGTYAHAGVFRDATDGVFKVFKGYTPEPSAAVDINTAHASFSLADFEANNVLIGSSPILANHATTKAYVDSAVSSGTGALDTDDIPEGITNLYYTDTRVENYLASGNSSNVKTERLDVKDGSVGLTILSNQASQQYISTTGSAVLSVNGSLQIDASTSTEITSDTVISGTLNTHTIPTGTGTFALTSDIPTVPTNVSSFTNDADYVTDFVLEQHLGDSSIDGTIGNTVINRINSAKQAANDYTDDNIPTNVSELTNDANYATTSQLFSGDYADLTNKPTIPTIPTNVSDFTNDAGYITSASIFSGDYADLTNKPTIPTNNNELTNGEGYTTYTSNQATNTGSAVTFNRIVLSSTTDASASSTSHGLQVGTTAGQNIIIDTNEVMARNNGAVSGLHLNADGGDVTINNNLTDKVTFSGGEITASGDITAYSDRALKRNIQTLENGLDKVMNMRGVTFLKDGKASLGVIAQEVETVIPEVVKQDQHGMRSVAYGNIVGVLIEAIKEQQKQIDELKAKLGNK